MIVRSDVAFDCSNLTAEKFLSLISRLGEEYWICDKSRYEWPDTGNIDAYITLSFEDISAGTFVEEVSKVAGIIAREYENDLTTR